MSVDVRGQVFDPGAALNAFSAGVTGAGAVVSFTGLTRDVTGGGLHALEIEHYPGMTERALSDMRAKAIDRFSLTDAMIIHRYGRMEPGEVIMMVVAAAPHRADAFKAADFLMDYLKSRAPFWKREITSEGADWVTSRSEDEDALNRW